MKTIVKKAVSASGSLSVVDPLIERKQGRKNEPSDIKGCRKKLSNPYYIDHAIHKIASELLHFLVK